MGRKPVDSKAQAANRRSRFLRVATTRTQKVLDDLAMLENCSRKDMYEYSAVDVDKILTALQEGINSVQQAFQDGRHSFSLNENNNEQNEV